MKVLVLSNGEFETREIEGTLAEFQRIVGGYIDMPFLSEELYDNGISIVINDEGKLIDGMNAEIVIIDKETGNTLDVVFGNCIFVGHDNYGGNVGLTDKQVETIKNSLCDSGILNNKNVVRLLFI